MQTQNMRRTLRTGVALAAVFVTVMPSVLRAVEWVGLTGGGDNINWHDAKNWSPEGVPGTAAAVTNTAGMILLTHETAELASFTMSGGSLVFSNWMTRLQAADVVLTNSAILTLP